MNPRPSQKEPPSHASTISTCTEFNFEDVCKPGNTLLWDLVQDDKAVSCVAIASSGSTVKPCKTEHHFKDR